MVEKQLVLGVVDPVVKRQLAAGTTDLPIERREHAHGTSGGKSGRRPIPSIR